MSPIELRRHLALRQADLPHLLPDSVALFLTILVVNWAIQDGKTNYMEGGE